MILQVNDLTKVFKKEKEFKAVDGLSFKVEQGEIVGLLGSNGAGKTSTIKMLAGLLLPDRGTINIFGLDNKEPKNLKQILKRSSFLLEGQRNIYYNLSLLENIMYFLGLKGISYRKKKDHVEKLIKFFGLKGEEYNPIFSYSTGMKQKASIILALAGDEEFIILDEPTLGLDVHSAKNLVQLLKQYVKVYRKTFLITTHNMNVIEALCERVLIMEKGKIIKDDYITNLKNLFGIKQIEIICSEIKEKDLADLKTGYRLNCEENIDGTYVLNLIMEDSNLGDIIIELEGKGVKVLAIKSDNSGFESSYIKIIDDYKAEEDVNI
ncbi:MAG: ABC transporter ATP-binding protein [Halanaerobiales bacterium]|nr:ABC transporter ATP-binding protein [Halanaerobiales bacterium]